MTCKNGKNSPNNKASAPEEGSWKGAGAAAAASLCSIESFLTARITAHKPRLLQSTQDQNYTYQDVACKWVQDTRGCSIIWFCIAMAFGINQTLCLQMFHKSCCRPFNIEGCVRLGFPNQFGFQDSVPTWSGWIPVSTHCREGFGMVDADDAWPRLVKRSKHIKAYQTSNLVFKSPQPLCRCGDV